MHSAVRSLLLLAVAVLLLVQARPESKLSTTSTATASKILHNRREVLHGRNILESSNSNHLSQSNLSINMSDKTAITAANEDSLKEPWYFKVVPIYISELPKFLSLSLMMFWIVFVFTMTRDTKDALIVTNCGAESIAFLKVYGVVPAAALFMVAYARMSNYFGPRTLFYATLAPFFVFYFVFAFILYPLRDTLHPMSWAVPEGGLRYAVNLMRYWTYSLYYIVSELWGSAGIPLLFWSCANDVIQIDQVQFASD